MAENIRFHKTLALTGKYPHSENNFGVRSLQETTGSNHHPDHDHRGGTLSEAQRSGPPHIGRGNGRMPATAHSDHGPHHHKPEPGKGLLQGG